MASLFMGSCKVSVLFMIVFSSLLLADIVTSTEFQVGGDVGWIVPKKDGQFYNEWASDNRFKVNDTVRFKYTKDSVMVVTDEEYNKCRSSHPIFFSNNGDSVFTFDRSGLFYFISGVTGHCERGQKMIIKVLEIQSPADQSANSTTAQHKKKNGGLKAAAPLPSFTIGGLFMAILGVIFY